MMGAIAGDVIGSIYEHRRIKTKDFPLFDPRCRCTDDSVLTIAIGHAILTNTPYDDALRTIGRQYPHAGYGRSFLGWLFAPDSGPYNSWGNGSAMRASPVGLAFDTEADVLHQAEQSAVVTHDHPEGVRGAQATALAVFLARQGVGKEELRTTISGRFGYDLDTTVEEIRPTYAFDVSCQGTVPQAVVCFLDSTSFEDAIRNAVSLGGDSDTLACITGSIAEAYYGGVPDQITETVNGFLPDDLRSIVTAFRERFCW
jgi:ADP-ribosylglycohydrolase